MIILAIETSCDDTCAAVLRDTCILSNIISSQTNLHAVWGGVVPDIAKRAHLARLPAVVALALKRARKSFEDIDFIAATRGPGLGIALGVGFNYAKELAKTNHISFVAVNHVEGHLLSVLLKNSHSLPDHHLLFPALGLTVSGGHTKIVLIKSIGDYQVVSETLDDAAGEALDKAAKLLGLGYPGGPVVERLAKTGNISFLKLPTPMANKSILNFSFSGLKTSFYYQLKKFDADYIAKNLANLSATFQNSVFLHLCSKYSLAIKKYQPKSLLATGGVLANRELKKRLRVIAKKHKLSIYFPYHKSLNTDNAAMIGIAAFYRLSRSAKINDLALDIDPRLGL